MSSDECYTGSGSCGSLNGWGQSFSPPSISFQINRIDDLIIDIRNLTVTLSAADTKFASTFDLYDVTAADLETADGGITWTTDSIKVQSIDFDDSSDLDE